MEAKRVAAARVLAKFCKSKLNKSNSLRSDSALFSTLRAAKIINAKTREGGWLTNIPILSLRGGFSRRGNRLHLWFCCKFQYYLFIYHMDCHAFVSQWHLWRFCYWGEEYPFLSLRGDFSRRGNRLISWYCRKFSTILIIHHMDCRASLAMTRWGVSYYVIARRLQPTWQSFSSLVL